MARRLQAMGSAKYQADGDQRTSGPGFGVTCHPGELASMLRTLGRSRWTVFLPSMGDLGHPRVPRPFLAATLATMAALPNCTFISPTKRPGRLALAFNDQQFVAEVAQAGTGPVKVDGLAARMPDQLVWPLPNLEIGTSVESDRYARRRVDQLRATPAALRFISAEPLLGPLHLDLTGIDWLIVGGESGPGARPMELSWALDLVESARAAGVPVFIKQLGTVWAAGHGKGNRPEEWPENLRIREFPPAAQTTPEE
jgi:protein gp37